jgi:ribonuclease BN (tRNA processing enzyme)
MSSFSLKCLGVGDGWPCADRNHSSFLYQFGRTRLLIDCGERVSGTLKALRASPDLVDHILLSHLHSDHFGGFFMLMQGFWLGPRRKDLTVHLPADGIQPLRQMLDAGMIFDEMLQFRLNYRALAAGEPFTPGRVKVTPFPTTHLESLRVAHQRRHPLRFEAFSFLFEAGGRRIGHSADLGAPEDLAPLLEKPLDLLVCELAHFTPKALFAWLRDKPVRRLVFMHVADRHWRNLRPVKALVKRMLPEVSVTFARDAEEIGL